MKVRLAPALGFLGLAGLSIPPGLAAQGIDLRGIDRTIESIRREIGAPGVALAVVRGDSVVHLRGYGVRHAATDDRVDEQTLFAIGSATKAFTAVLLGTLVDEGHLGWDDPVANRLPGFRLHDPATSAGITIRDLLAHRSGLPPANLMWLTRRVDPDTLIHRLRWLEPAAGFRSAFTYQNVLYAAAGRIAERATGRSWETLLDERIFGPLGMSSTNVSVDSLAGRRNVAAPHVLIDGTARPVPYRSLDHVGPAGSINASAADLGRWLRFLLADGVWNGERVIEGTTLAETTSAQMIVPADPVMTAFHPAARLQGYGMGWFLSDFHGRTLLAHGGGTDGMSALVAWVPEEDLGVAILTNLQTPTPPIWIFGMLYGVLDPALDVQPTDWRTPAARLNAMFDEMTGRGAEPERVGGTEPALGLDAYVGTYGSRTLGAAHVTLRRPDEPRHPNAARALVLEIGTLQGVLEHWHFDTFRIRWQSEAWRAAAGPGWVTFRLDQSGAVDAMDLVVIPGEIERLTRRVPS